MHLPLICLWICLIDSISSGQVYAQSAGSIAARNISQQEGTARVEITVSPESSTIVYAVEENLPAGFTASLITENGVLDSVNQKVKWGPFFDNQSRTFAYTLTPPDSYSGSVVLNGSVSMDGVDVVTQGDGSWVIAGEPGSSVSERTINQSGRTVAVSLSVQPAGGTIAYAVEENLPTGFTASSITENGVLDSVNQKVKWGPFFDNQARTFAYNLTPPDSYSGSAVLSGFVSMDGVDVATQGDRSWVVSGEPDSSVGERTINQSGGTVEVSLSVKPSNGTIAYAVEESLPSGFSAVAISDGGAIDAVNNKIKWGPFFDNTSRTLTYELTSPQGFSGQITLTGFVSLDGQDFSVGGDLSLEIGGQPPAGLSIVTQPIGGAVTLGESFAFSVSATGSVQGYQWFKDGQILPGATSSSFTIPVIGLEDAGSYSVSISDGVQEVLSEAAMVQVSGPVENAPPTIALIGDALLELSQGTTYTEPGVSATDPEDGDLTDQVVIDGQVNASVPGVYTLRYSVSDQQGLSATVTRAVQVISLPVENTHPTITLFGEATLRIDLGGVFEEPGFTASDEQDGDLTNAVAVYGMVDTSSPGSYTLEYTVTDAGGLTAAMIREVIVRTPSNASDVPNGMVLIEDLGPVGIGNDNAALTLHSVDTFYMDAYEVSKGLWDEVRQWGMANGYGDLSEGRAGEDGDDTHPVTEVSWMDAVKWCNARSEMEGLRPAYYLDEDLWRVFRNREEVMLHVDRTSGYRLPTLLEWEKAARGNLYANPEKTMGYDYPWGSNEKTPEDANYWPSLDNTTPVGTYSPNPYGLYDMSGNVWEHCWDPITTSQGEVRLSQRYMRGGGWELSSKAAVHSQFTPPVDDQYNFLGFRSVLTPGLPGLGEEHGDILVRFLMPTSDEPFYRLAWESVSGASYIVETVSELGESWVAAEDQPVVATSNQTEWPVNVADKSRFFRVRIDDPLSGGTTRIVSLNPFPQDGAFGIPQLAPISMVLPDHDDIDDATIQLAVGDLGTFAAGDDALTFDQGTLTFDPSLAGALGDPESLVTANVAYSDQQGNRYTYDWSFRIQKQTILSGDVFVLGSPQAQFQGQALNPRQLAIYEDLGVTPSVFAIRQQTGNAPWSLDEVKDDSLIFSYEGDTPPNFQVGQFLANLTPAKKDEIFYRKVAVVLKDVPEKQKVSVFTKDVGLLEIFVQASMLSHPVGFPAAVYAIAQEGFLVNASQGYLLESPIEETWSPEPGVDLTLSGNLSIEPKLSLSLDIQGSTVEDFYLRQDGKMTTSLGASLKVTESHQWETATEDPIFSADRVFYLGWVGVVPIWLDMEFEVNAEAEASYEAAGEISTGIQTTYDYWSELVYSTRNPSLSGMFASPPSRQLEVTPLKVTLEGHAEAAVRLVPELTMELESLFGVRVDLTPEVGLKGDVSFVNGEMETAAFELYGRLDLNAGLSIEGIEDDLLPQIEPVELVYWPWKFLYPGYQFEITRQPEGGRFTKGEEVLLRVEVDVLHESFDPEDIRYQWYKDGILLSGETEPLLRIDEFSENEEGEYWVEVWKDGEEERVISDVVRVAEGIRWGDARLVELKTIKGTSTVNFSELTVSYPPQDLVELPSSKWNSLTSTFNPITISYSHDGMKARLGSAHWLSQLELENWEDFLRALGYDENDSLPRWFVIPDRPGVKPEAMSLREVYTYLSTDRTASKTNDLIVRFNPHSEIRPTLVYEIYLTPDGEVPTFPGSGGSFETYVGFDITQGSPDEKPWSIHRRSAALTFNDGQVEFEEPDGPIVFGIADGTGLVTNPIDMSHSFDLGLVKHVSYQSGDWSISSETFTPSGIHTYDYEITVHVIADDPDQTDQWYVDEFEPLIEHLQ